MKINFLCLFFRIYSFLNAFLHKHSLKLHYGRVISACPNVYSLQSPNEGQDGKFPKFWDSSFSQNTPSLPRYKWHWFYRSGFRSCPRIRIFCLLSYFLLVRMLRAAIKNGIIFAGYVLYSESARYSSSSWHTPLFLFTYLHNVKCS